MLTSFFLTADTRTSLEESLVTLPFGDRGCSFGLSLEPVNSTELAIVLLYNTSQDASPAIALRAMDGRPFDLVPFAPKAPSFGFSSSDGSQAFLPIIVCQFHVACVA